MDKISLYDSAMPCAQSQENPGVREKLKAEGSGALNDRELICAILGTGIKGKNVYALADEVLELLGGANRLPHVNELIKTSGMGLAKACAVAAALELGKRYYGSREVRLSSPKDVWPFISHWADRKQEHFVCCSLNGAHEVIAVRIVSMGLVNRTVVHPREVFADPITDRACAVIVAHNHPSGKLEPSPEDRFITTRLKDASKILGIHLLDHLIFSREGYFSFVENGLLEIDDTNA